jgi:hypothetical protein
VFRIVGLELQVGMLLCDRAVDKPGDLSCRVAGSVSLSLAIRNEGIRRAQCGGESPDAKRACRVVDMNAMPDALQRQKEPDTNDDRLHFRETTWSRGRGRSR